MSKSDSTTEPLADEVNDLVRMSHRRDPDTSAAAAEKASRGTKRATIQTAILRLLVAGPATPKELHREYFLRRRDEGWPSADLQDIRRRLTELQHDFKFVIDTDTRRNGERIMALAPEAVAA